MVHVNLLYFILYGFLASMLPFMIVLVALNRRAKRRGMAFSVGHNMLAVLFAIYIFAALYVTSAGTLYDLMRYGVGAQSEQINLLPFSRAIDRVGYFQNILLFMPLGFLLPLIWEGLRKWWCALLAGFSFSLLIEASQLFNNRSTDVDDLIMNTLGALLGYVLFKVFARITKWDARKACGSGWEPVLYIAVLFLGRFLLFDDLGLARLLYHF